MRSGLALLLVLISCSVDEVDLEGKACPCAAGYQCDATKNVCVKNGAGGQGGSSAGGAPSGGTGGTATGGASSGGTGGTNTGGASTGATGGTNTGGTSSGGTAGTAAGGAPPGGTGGSATGGTSSGGAGTGGSSVGGGAGTCAVGMANCNTSSPDCETDVSSSAKNCGSCSQDCSVQGSGSNGFQCVGGVCMCSSDNQCDATLTSGNSCNTSSGLCTCLGTPCGRGEACAKTSSVFKCSCKGSAACAAGQTCCSAGGCKDLSSDPQNCGTCGHECTSGTCQAGACT